MNASEFVGRLRSEVQHSVPAEIAELLKKPPGRRPEPQLLELSSWFLQIEEKDKVRVMELLEMAAHHAVFGVLTVLDGARRIDDREDPGSLELRYLRGVENTLLNDPHEPLHHLL